MATKKFDHGQAKTKKQACLWTSNEKIVGKMVKRTEELVNELRETGRMTLKGCKYDGVSVPVLDGNSKLGSTVKTMSLRPVVDCGNCAQCSKECYDLRHDVINLQCMEYRCATAALWKVLPHEEFWDDVERQLKYTCICRYNIGGDILDYDYFAGMVRVARNIPHCRTLVFTKMYDVVNRWIDENGELPENLHVLFSYWPNTEMKNPHNLPVSFPVYNEKDIEEDPVLAEFSSAMPKFYWHCNDDCTGCALQDQGCFKLMKGEAVGFNYH